MRKSLVMMLKSHWKSRFSGSSVVWVQWDVSLRKQTADCTELGDKISFPLSSSCYLIQYKCLLDFTHRARFVWFRGTKGVLLSRKSSWQAGALRLMKLKPRVGRQRPLLAAGSPGVKPCNMLLFPAPSRPRTRTWRFPRSSSSCRWRAKTVRVQKGKVRHTWFIQQWRRWFAQFHDENGANILMINSVNILRCIMNIKPQLNLKTAKTVWTPQMVLEEALWAPSWRS